MFSTLRILAVAALVASGSLAYALDSNDVVNMSKAKAGDEVIIAQIKATKARFALTADDIIRLKKEGVSDAVIKVMIESAPAPAQPTAEPRPEPEPQRAVPAPAPTTPQAQAPAPAAEPQPQAAQTTIIEKHYYAAPPRVYCPAPVVTYYVPAPPVCSPVYRYETRRYDYYPHVTIGGRVRLGHHVTLGFRL